jgi:hypothetical protein
MDDGLAPGWEVWSDEATKVVLAYRPDVFNTTDYPAPCMPTVYLTKGKRSRRPGRDRPAPEDAWYVTLYLEPEVSRETERFDSREAAVAGAREVAARFAAGEVDYRDLYQVPREEYFAALDELTGAQD